MADPPAWRPVASANTSATLDEFGWLVTSFSQRYAGHNERDYQERVAVRSGRLQAREDV
jgi:hypothetical protein